MGMRPPGVRGYLSDEEKAHLPKVTGALLQRILGYLKPYWLQFALVFAVLAVSSVLGLLPSIITGRIVDEALVGRDMALLVKLLFAALVTLTLSEAVGVLESYINAWISQRIVFDMKNQMYAHLTAMPHSFFTSEKQGDIITRMNSDISGVSSVISGTLTSVVSNVLVVATSLVALFSISWQLALAGVAVIPLLIIPTRSVGRARYALLSEGQSAHDALNEIISETLSVSGSLLVKLFTRERAEEARFRDANERVTQLSLKEQRSGKWFRVVMGMFTQLGPLLIYFAGGYFIISRSDPSLTVGAITATVALINRLYRPVQSLLNVQVDFTRSLALFSRIFAYLDREIAIRSPENGKKPDLEKGDIFFINVKFSYSPDVPLLTNICFCVPAGKMYAIVGPSGSGKSTLVNLIPRLYDVQGGSVKLGGVDVREIELTYLRQSIGVVTQEAYLFNGTVRDNLLVGRPAATEQELIAACRAANIYDFIRSQPDGLETVVGNRGLKLSGGEKQRLSLARVILKDPKILILDEATSALDSISENAIQQALDTLLRGRTSIVIAHRLSTILKADDILVVNNGRIVEHGRHADLLDRDGVYAELYTTQFQYVLEQQKGGN